MPRPGDPCLNGGYGRSAYEDVSFTDGCGAAVEGGYYCEDEMAVGSESANLAGYGELPALSVGLERLGQIPNDMGISAVAPAGGPAQPSR